MQVYYFLSFSETINRSDTSGDIEEKFMNQYTNPLNNLKIASPCSADWNQMVGDDRQRHCGECKLNVYNLSGMTKRETEDLILTSEGRVCMRIYRRADGTVLTKDCPVGWRAVKQRISKTATAFASMIFAVLSGIGLTNYFADSTNVSRTMGTIAIENHYPTMGEIEPLKKNPDFKEENIQMGKVAPNNLQMAGGIGNLEAVKQEIKKNRKK